MWNQDFAELTQANPFVWKILGFWIGGGEYPAKNRPGASAEVLLGAHRLPLQCYTRPTLNGAFNQASRLPDAAPHPSVVLFFEVIQPDGSPHTSRTLFCHS